ncbi:MAG: radical SAM protein [Myxococcota bacterium]|nr:radical SAM protein [Myxococcota bacterium]
MPPSGQGIFRGRSLRPTRCIGRTLLQVFSIFSSIQGESTRAGLPCAFIRLAGCSLRCAYCDTPLARVARGRSLSIPQIISEVSRLGPNLVAVTGGEPLLQKDTLALLSALCEAGFNVLLETSGAFSIIGIDPRVRIILDVKCPDSGMSERMVAHDYTNLHSGNCELKFVISSFDDFCWAKQFCVERQLISNNELLFSPALGRVSLSSLARWILDAGLQLRLHPQLHTLIWPEAKGER